MNDSCKSMDEYLEEFLLYKQSLRSVYKRLHADRETGC